ncbi:MAG: iron dependent repressor, metal binding and dimerization domain protein [Clostridiales bacterium]|jgi:Mn-dependent DtxR family transcriptional regulator|nr:DtxR family transcriptional regulator [Eubacteriales bacterium]MDH7566213.1 iron dependent repressor, metal binding and dimerization domain protein [Clostridiales bacterium]
MHDGETFHTVRGYQILSQNKNALTSAMEDYLEMIYRNIMEDGYMRINILSELLNVKPSSATKMVQKLTDLGLLDYKKYGIIFLTENGKALGRFLLNRHNIIEKFFKAIGVSENILEETELVEHSISVNTLKNIELLNEFLDRNPDVMRRLQEFKENHSEKNEE